MLHLVIFVLPPNPLLVPKVVEIEDIRELLVRQVMGRNLFLPSIFRVSINSLYMYAHKFPAQDYVTGALA